MGLGAYLGNGCNRLYFHGRYIMVVKYAPLWNKLDFANTDAEHKAENDRVEFINTSVDSIIENHKRVYGEPSDRMKQWLQMTLIEYVEEFHG